MRYKIKGLVNGTSLKHEFIGEYGWEMKWSSSFNGFIIERQNESAYAVYNDTLEYPLGLKAWTIINDNCPTIKDQYLLFSSCNYNQFTCNDGSCISVENRCDIIQHCSDNSDEVDCQKVQVDEDAYRKDKAPAKKWPESEDDKRLAVELSLSRVEIAEINYLKSIINVRFWLSLTWRDTRVTFKHLDYNNETLLSNEDVKKLWMPYLTFESTPKISRTVEDQFLVVNVIGTNPRSEKDLTKLHDEVQVYYGSDVLINASRLYNEIFTCPFDLGMYPFDSQICTMTFRLIKNQQDYVRLMPKCSWKIILNQTSTVGEFTVTEMKGKPAGNGKQKYIDIEIHIKRSPGKMFSSTYLPTFCLLVLVQMTFYFPEDNFQVRATVSLSCLLILSTFFASTSRSLPTTTKTIFVEIWMMFAVLITFFEVILHTVIGYIKELEKADAKVKKIKPNNYIETNRPLSRSINHFCGRIIFPFIFVISTLIYATIAMVHYSRSQTGSEIHDECKN